MSEFQLRLSTGQRLPLIEDRQLTAQDVLGVDAAPTTYFAIVVRNPHNRALMGLKNVSPHGWSATLANGEARNVEPGRSILLAVGTRINFGDFTGQIETIDSSRSGFAARRRHWMAITAAFLCLAGLALGGWYWREHQWPKEGRPDDGRQQIAGVTPTLERTRPLTSPLAPGFQGNDGAAEDEAQKWYKRAIESYQQERLEEALTYLAMALRSKPEFQLVYRMRSEIYLDQAQVLKKTDDAVGLTGLARKALADAGKACELGPEDPRAHLARAWAHYYLNDTANAVDDFYRALQLDPTNVDARSAFQALALGPLKSLFRKQPETVLDQSGSRAPLAEEVPSAEDEQDLLPPIPGAFASPDFPVAGLNFNVLRYAIVDQQAGTLTLIGESDSRWQTGPIPYLEHLQAAVKSPRPWVSFEVPQEEIDRTRTEVSPAWLDKTIAWAGDSPGHPLTVMLLQANLGWGLEEAVRRTARLSGREGHAAQLAEMRDFSIRARERTQKTGFWLPPQFLAQFGDLAPRARVEFGDVPTDSQMARVLLQADYCLKLATSWVPLRRHVAGFQTFDEFCCQKGVPASEESQITRWAIEPVKVSISYSESGSKIFFSFSEPQLKIIGTHLAGRQKTSAALLDGYARQMTDQYGSLAQWFPPLHELREVAKVIALTEVLHKRRVPLSFPDKTWNGWEAPASVPGILSVVFFPGRRSLEHSIHFEAEGGISFQRVRESIEELKVEVEKNFQDWIRKLPTNNIGRIVCADPTMRAENVQLPCTEEPPTPKPDTGGADTGLRRRGGSGPPRKGDKPAWLVRLEEGNAFNKVQAPRYPYNEVYVEKPTGNGYYRLDSYNPSTGEIVSRKFTQLSKIQETTGIKYINELARKYPPGAKIADVDSSKSLRGQRLQGQMILELPPQEKPIPQSVIDAANQKGIIIRDINGRVYNP